MNDRARTPTSYCYRLGVGFSLSALAALAFLGPAFPGTPQPGEAKRVLILHSYHQGYAWADDVMAGIRSELARSGVNMECSVEYMDTKRFDIGRLFPKLADLYGFKFRDYNFDIVLASDNHALDFLLAHRERLFPRVPIVFCGINRFEPSMIEGHAGITGVAEVQDIKGNVELILRFHPDTKRIASVTSYTTTSAIHRRDVRVAMSGFRDLELIELLEPTPEALSQALRRLPPRTVVMFSGYLKDKAGKAYTVEEGIRFLRDNCALPVYSPLEFMIAGGVIGGVVVSGRSHGEHAARIALRVLGGEPPESIDVVSAKANIPMFDHHQLSRFGLSRADLPEGSVVLNEPQSFHYRHRKAIWVGIAFVLFQTLAVIGLSVNVVRRHRAERELREREQFNYALFEYNPVETIVVDGAGRVIKSNKAKRTSGDRQPGVGDVMYKDYAAGHDIDMYTELMSCIREGKLRHFPERAYGDRVLAVTISPFPGGAIIISSDITERKRVETHLAKLNECFLQFGSEPEKNIDRLVALCGEMMGGLCALYNRLDGDLLCSVGQWNTPDGYKPEDRAEGHICHEVIQRGSDSLLVVRNLAASPYAKTDPNVAAHDLQTYIGKAVKFGETSVGSLCVVYQKDFVPGRNEEWLMGVLASAIAVEEERLHAAEELRQSEERFRAIADYTYDCENWIGNDGKLLWVNPAVTRLIGYSREECTQMEGYPVALVHESDRPQVREFCRQAFEQHTSGHDLPVRLRRKDGAVVWTSLSWQPIYDAAGDCMGIRCSIHDISKRVQAEEERKKLEDKVLQTQKLESLGVLAGGIAHDFNNLLMAVLGSAELALVNTEPSLPAREYLENIRTVASRASELCRQLSAYSGKGKVEVDWLDLSALVRETGELLDVSISKKAVIHYELPSGLPSVEGDATQIRQVLMNLVVNASEAVGDENGVITVETGTGDYSEEFLRHTYLGEALPAGRYVTVRVSDTGCGMDEETRARMFDPFFTTKFVGRGLGLAAALGIIRAHNGALDVQSAPGEGSAITIYLPGQKRRAGRKAKRKSPERWQGHGTVLLADDEATVRKVTAEMLQHMGFTVLTARNGLEAVDVFRRRRDDISLVLLDMTMPGLSGEEAFREIRRIDGGARIVLSSGHDENDTTVRFKGKGLAGFVHKPYEMDTLGEVVRAALAS